MTIIACLLLMAAPPPSVEELLEARLLQRVAAVDAELKGVMGVHAIDLETGRTISYHADTVFPQASSIKIPILIELFRQVGEGKQNLKAQVTLEQRDLVGGSGHLQSTLKLHPMTLTVEDLAVAMISSSDNTATNKLISMVGMQNVNATVERMGFRHTRLQRIMIDVAAAARNDENISTPLEMARIMELIYRGKAVSAAASKQMLEILKLPDADFRKTVPANVVVAAKPGGLTGVHCETGVVFVQGRPFVLSVAGTFLTGDANPVPAVTKLFYEHFATLAKSNKYGNGGVR
ncbi:MAG: serine hydrolase [Bryobacteraceae bacterium]|nr:serine hydrolase [Bryobacteraceae bacterium]